METLFIFSRGMALGAVLLVCIKLWQQDRHLFSGGSLLGLLIGVAAYLVAPLLSALPVLESLTILISIAVTPLFWLFALSVFMDWDQKKLRPESWHLAVIVLYLLLAFASYFDFPEAQTQLWSMSYALFYSVYALRFFFVAMALVVVVTGWKQDLVEARRRLRSVLVAVGGAYILVVSLVEVFFAEQNAPLALETLNSVSIMTLMMAVAYWLLLVNRQGLSEALDIASDLESSSSEIAAPMIDSVGISDPGGRVEPTLSRTDQERLHRLTQVMEIEQGYRQPDLTIVRLSQQLSIPEHHLRRLINKQLGYRNFNDYLSRYRVTEAAQRLADPAEERLPILTIAMDVGFASLTPFNRAFKQQLGVTPSEYRRQKIAD